MTELTELVRRTAHKSWGSRAVVHVGTLTHPELAGRWGERFVALCGVRPRAGFSPLPAPTYPPTCSRCEAKLPKP